MARQSRERDIVGGFCDLRDDCHVCRERTLARDSLPRVPRSRGCDTPLSHPNVPVTCAIAPAHPPASPVRTHDTGRPPVRPLRHCTPCTRQLASLPLLLPCAPASKRVSVNPVISRKPPPPPPPPPSSSSSSSSALSCLPSRPSHLSYPLSHDESVHLRPSNHPSRSLFPSLATISLATTTHCYSGSPQGG